MLAQFAPGSLLVGLTNGRQSYLLLADQLGTPVALANLDGAIVQTMRYDSFGNPLRGLQGALCLPLGFAGGLFDADTGLTRFVWRDYDADTGRFTSLDPLGARGGDDDWYGYCVDDPVNRTDAWGLEESWWETTPGGRIILEGISGAGTGAIGGAAVGAPTGAGMPLGALVGGLMGFPAGLLKGTVKEIGRSVTGSNDPDNPSPQEDAPMEQRQTLEKWWRKL